MSRSISDTIVGTAQRSSPSRPVGGPRRRAALPSAPTRRLTALGPPPAAAQGRARADYSGGALIAARRKALLPLPEPRIPKSRYVPKVPGRTLLEFCLQNGHLRRLAQAHATLNWPQYGILTGTNSAGTQDSTGLGGVPKLTILQGSTGSVHY